MIDLAHMQNCKVIISAHNFQYTPSVEEMCKKLRLMMSVKGDIVKLAVMPNKKQDVAALLEATAMVSSIADKPLITMSMGMIGTVSRLVGELFGSSVSFVNVCGSSAPGQVKADEVIQFLDLLHDVCQVSPSIEKLECNKKR